MNPARRAWARALGIAAGLGAVTSLGQAPFDLPAAMFFGLIAAIWYFPAARSSKAAALYGWAFGVGYFAVSLRWIISPFLVDVARHGWMAPFALVFLAAGLALFWGLAFWAARRLSRQSWGLILTLPAVELLRAYIFTGFPWAMPAQALVDGALGQGLAWVGPYVMNFVLVAGAVFVARAQAGRALMILRGGVAVVLTGLMWLPPMASPSAPSGQTIRLIQPNATQRDKWDPALVPLFFQRQLDYTAALPDGPAPDLILWPETAIPWALDVAATPLAQIGAAAQGTPVALGALRRTQTQFFNAMVVVDAAGEITHSYDKHHLVPFGEYMPLGDLLARVGIYGLAASHGHGYSAGPGAQVLDLGAIGRALPLICYEAVFAHDVNAALERPNVILHLTNDAWFGTGAGPQQHLAQARMRAIEQGLPVARAANTGISAMIDGWGRITASLPLNTAGYLDAALPAPRAPTLYSRTGDLPFALLLLAGLGGAVLRVRKVHD